MSTEDEFEEEPLSKAIMKGLKGKCPQCGDGKLFTGFLEIKGSCAVCGFDYGSIDTADGPAFFIMTIVGFVIVIGAYILEVTVHPPVWVHMVVWMPMIVLLSIALLRPFKGVMAALQHRFSAGPLGANDLDHQDEGE